MLTPYFAPDASIGTRRSLSLANYLANRDWDVDVVTAAESDISLINTTSHFAVGLNVRIHRVPSVDLIEKFLRPVKCLSRHFAGKVTEHNRPAQVAKEKDYFDDMGRSIRWLWPAYIPDIKLQWALRLAFSGRIRRLAERADCIYSSSPPNSIHITGAILKTSVKKPWVIDFRDPWVNNPFRELPNNLLVVKYDRYLEKKVISLGDRIVCATPLMMKDFIDRHDEIRGKCSFVLNGYDPALFSEDGHVAYMESERVKLTHVGSLYGKRDITFLLRALSILQKESPDMAKDFCFEFIGPGAAAYEKLIEEMGLNDMVRLYGPIPYDTALDKYRQATVCICVGVSGTNAEFQIPAKLYEFICLGKPIFALTGAASDISVILKNAGVDYFLADPSNPVEIYRRLIELHRRWKNGKLVYGGNKEKRMGFDSRRMVERLEDIFLEVSSKDDLSSQK